MYFESIVASPACATDDVGLEAPRGRPRDPARTPNFSYIVPDRCDDGNPTPCTAGAPAGVAPAGTLLAQVVPEILASKAYKENGLLVITVDEAPSTGEFADSSSCCGEPLFPNDPLKSITGAPRGGGAVGALLLSPYVKGGTTSQEPFNHFSLLRTVEDLFGLKHLGYAGLAAVKSFEPVDVHARRRSFRSNAVIRRQRSTGADSRALSAHSRASMWRGSRRWSGCRSKRRVSPQSTLPARISGGESKRRTRLSASMPHAGASALRAVSVVSATCAMQMQQARPPPELPRQHPAQRGGVGVCRSDEAVRLDSGELEHPPAGVDGAARLLLVEPHELRRAPAARGVQARRGRCATAQLLVLEAVLGDRVAREATFVQPVDHLRAALAERMQIASGDHQQRDAIDAVVVEPVADQRAALEGRGLDVVQCHRDPSPAEREIGAMPHARAPAARLPCSTCR